MKYLILVTYEPVISHLEKVILSLYSADETEFKIILFDNSENSIREKLSQDCFSKVHFLSLGENVGLAKAYNSCTDYAFSLEDDAPIDGFLFFDQDSHVSKSQVVQLISHYDRISKEIDNIGILGASAVDLDGNAYNMKELPVQSLGSSFSAVECEYVMSSFSFIPAETIRRLGLYDESLFIDLVDSEFCFRAKKSGLLNLISTEVVFTHEVGIKNVSLFGKRLFAVSSPLRNYYQTRNVILVSKKFGWILFPTKLLARRIIQFTISGLVSRNLLLRYKYMLMGLYHGVIGKGGKLDP
ncbi:MAG: rhamnosyltransferase [Sediminicola sp.]|jgi:rhamnosyltransferase